MLIGDVLRHSANRAPGRTAIVEGDSRITYSDFNRKVNQLANALLKLNLDKGAKVAIMSTSRLEYALAYFGIARTGYVSAHISTRGTVDDIAHMLNKVRASVLMFESKLAPVVMELADKIAGQVHFIVLDNPSTQPRLPPGCHMLIDFIAGQPCTEPAEHIRDKDPVAITFTGGTTGLPKGVVVSHRARCATVYAAAIDFGLNEQDIIAASTPLFHTAGLFVWFTTAILHGATVVLQRTWNPATLVDIIEQERVTAIFLVPSQLNDLISQPGFSTERLKSLRKVGYAGAPLGSALRSRIFRALPFVEFTENYGQSETCPITVRCPWHPEDKLGTVGRPAANVDIEIVDAQGNPLPRGEVGEITVRAASNFDEYFDDPVQTAAAYGNNDEWLWTGDLGYMDPDGFLTLVDRSKDMLITGGENVYPAEIENTLYSHAAVGECAVFGIPDDNLGEVAVAHVVCKRNMSVSESSLIEYCAGKIAHHKVPRLIKFVDKLPRTPVGKIRKNVLKESYWAERKKRI